MAFETINLGTQPAGTGGDTARSAFEKTNRNFLAAEVLYAAMSQAQFEAIRAQNKERYAASGWVSFGNHESGKQVNECKPGLYTALTTANTLLIGKTGGVGGSKTDNASVHIDGVVFNLTNQFVLTLPSQPTSTQPERMDMYGIEAEKVEISAASPNAYQGGLRGVGASVNLFTAADQQKKDFFSANANTTYIGTDGKIYQWQLYKVSFAGTTDGVPSPTEQGYTLNSFGDLWLKSGKNLLYFGNVLRLNEGGYHPSFNPLGAAKFVGDTFWYNTAASITSRADCFDTSKLLVGSGSIASGKSGRPETGGRYYDAIYADGFGGVCRDMRYSSFGIGTVEFYEADLSAKNGDYRGFENLVFSKPLPYTSVSFYNGATLIRGPDLLDFFQPNNGSDYNGHRKINGYNVLYIATDSGGQYAYLRPIHGDVSSSFSGGFLIAEKEISVLTGAFFLQTDVIGSTANIISTQQLSNGWLGRYNNVVPTGNIESYTLTRKNIDDYVGVFETTNNGVSWTYNENVEIDEVNNNRIVNHSTSSVLLYCYRDFSYQTEPYNNSVVHGGEGGLGSVSLVRLYLSDSGALLQESMISTINKDDAAALTSSKLNWHCISNTGAMNHYYVYYPEHDQLKFLQSAPSNGSGSIKFLNYNVNLKQQAFVFYSYTELKHNGNNWGDDEKMTIIDNQSTKTDLNGNTVLVGTAKLREPIGWIKNKV